MKKSATKICVFGMAVLLASLALVGCGSSSSTEKKAPAAAATVTLKLGNVVQKNHPMNVACEKFAQKVAQKTNNRIKIQVFPARQLGDDRQLFEQVQQGALDMAEISAAPIGSTAALASALQLPFLFNNWDQYLKVMKDPVTDKLLAGLDKYQVKGLAIYNAGFRHFVTVGKTVNQPADMQGLKFRVAETPLHVDIFKALGASPTPMPYGEIYSGLQNKVIDGLEMDLSAILMEKHYEVAKNVTLSKHFTWPAILMINANKFKSLSPEDQKAILDSAKEVIDENVKDISDIEKKAVAELKTKGVNLKEFSVADTAPFIEATKAIEAKYSGQDPLIVDFVKRVKEIK